MRQIEVDTDVFAMIWSRRAPEESTENQILRRILLADPPAAQPSLKVSGRLSSPHKLVDLEVNTSSGDTHTQLPAMEPEVGKIRWVDDIQVVLRQLGGRAYLESIYKNVEERRREAGRSVPKTLDAVIRRTLEDHSSDSANFRAEDLFRLLGRGEWALR